MNEIVKKAIKNLKNNIYLTNEQNKALYNFIYDLHKKNKNLEASVDFLMAQNESLEEDIRQKDGESLYKDYKIKTLEEKINDGRN